MGLASQLSSVGRSVGPHHGALAFAGPQATDRLELDLRGLMEVKPLE